MNVICRGSRMTFSATTMSFSLTARRQVFAVNRRVSTGYGCGMRLAYSPIVNRRETAMSGKRPNGIDLSQGAGLRRRTLLRTSVMAGGALLLAPGRRAFAAEPSVETASGKVRGAEINGI